MKHLAAALLLAAAGHSQAAVLFDNGPVVDDNGLSVMTAPDTTYGWSSATEYGYANGDNFQVTGNGWTVTDLDFFAYQTMAVTRFYFKTVTWSVLRADGTEVANGFTVVTNGGYIGYRVSSTAPTETVRNIAVLKADVSDFHLPPGKYALKWSISGSENYGGPFVPPVLGRSGNARGTLFDGKPAPVKDSGSGRKYDLPFRINGTAD